MVKENMDETNSGYSKHVGGLKGKKIDDNLLSQVTKSCVEQSDPVADQRGPVEFKKYVAGIVIDKALKRALERS